MLKKYLNLMKWFQRKPIPFHPQDMALRVFKEEYPDTTETAESRLKATFFAVEATSAEQLNLWRDHSSQSTSPRHKKICEWQQVTPGWLVTVGKLGKRPVVISMSWVRIDGFLVLFWYPCSQVVDHVQIDNWFEEHYDQQWGGGRRAVCDASNFHLCVQAIDAAKARQSKLANA